MTTDILRLPDEHGARRVWPVPDEVPVSFDKPRCCYASWITPELMKAAEEG